MQNIMTSTDTSLGTEWFTLLEFSLVAVALVLISLPLLKLHRKARAKLMDFYIKHCTPEA